MKITRAHIIAIVLLAAASGGAWAIYEYYVKEEFRDLADHQLQAKNLEDKIKNMQTLFSGTKPPVMLTAYAEKAEPWQEAVARRSTYFSMGDTVLAVSVPEEEIPRFYYREEFPKRLQALREKAFNKGVQLNVNFGVPQGDASGQLPTRADVEEWLTKIEIYSSIAELLINANAQQILDISPWPPRPGPRGINGSVEYRTYGVNMTMAMQNLAKFLESLQLEDRYFNVDHIFIHNKSLRNPAAPLQVQLLLTQARYIPAEVGGGGAAAGPQFNPTAAFSPSAAFAGGGFGGDVFGGGGFGGGDDRRTNPKPTLMRRILQLFPF